MTQPHAAGSPHRLGDGKTPAIAPNQGLEGSAEQRARCSVPAALRASAPPQPRRWASRRGARSR
jgi:hypothetical protein